MTFVGAVVCAFLTGCFMAGQIGLVMQLSSNPLAVVPLMLPLLGGFVLTAWMFFAP